MDIDIKTALAHILDKLSSARFLAFLALTATMCLVVGKAFDLIFKVIDVMIKSVGIDQTFSAVKDIFLVVFTAFGTSFATGLTFYFTRTDRGTNGNGKEPLELKK